MLLMLCGYAFGKKGVCEANQIIIICSTPHLLTFPLQKVIEFGDITMWWYPENVVNFKKQCID